MVLINKLYKNYIFKNYNNKYANNYNYFKTIYLMNSEKFFKTISSLLIGGIEIKI